MQVMITDLRQWFSDSRWSIISILPVSVLAEATLSYHDCKLNTSAPVVLNQMFFGRV